MSMISGSEKGSSEPYSGRGIALRILSNVARLSADEAAQAQIQAQGLETLNWLREGSRSFRVRDGEAIVQEVPWWDRALPETNLVARKVCREEHLRWKAYEHGVLHFVLGLLRKDLLEPRKRASIGALEPDELDVLLGGDAKPVFIDILGYEEGCGLKDLAKLFGNGLRKTAWIRDERVTPWAKLGLLEGGDGGSATGYLIKASYAAKVFFEDVYAVIVDETDVRFRRGRLQ